MQYKFDKSEKNQGFYQKNIRELLKTLIFMEKFAFFVLFEFFMGASR
jgi:hypothetical protein